MTAPLSSIAGSVPLRQRFYASASFTRPADTNAYAAGDLVANATSAGLVVPLTMAVPPWGRPTKWKLTATGTALDQTTHPLQFGALIFASKPVPNVGDNGAFGGVPLASPISVACSEADYLGRLVFGANGASGLPTPAPFYAADAVSALAVGDTALSEDSITTFAGPVIEWQFGGTGMIYALLVTNAPYTPNAGEVFKLECWGVSGATRF